MNDKYKVPKIIPTFCNRCIYFSQDRGIISFFTAKGICSFYESIVHPGDNCIATTKFKQPANDDLQITTNKEGTSTFQSNSVIEKETKFVSFSNDSGIVEIIHNKKWNWAAFFLNSIWAISKKLYSIGIPLLIFQILCIYLLFLSEKSEKNFGSSFTFIQVFIFLPIQLYLGTMGNKLVEKNLKWHGFKKVEKQDKKTSDIE